MNIPRTKYTRDHLADGERHAAQAVGPAIRARVNRPTAIPEARPSTSQPIRVAVSRPIPKARAGD
jgi:hypothetical protein